MDPFKKHTSSSFARFNSASVPQSIQIPIAGNPVNSTARDQRHLKVVTLKMVTRVHYPPLTVEIKLPTVASI